ncbi:hypothetical protein SAMN05216227_105710 [Pseudorhodobacter antarcticus]|uniref:Uncharacterized protein n=1 Tax=Pseudorhodobacter antarcticus TaxID=1077947 RepID=A0A1H8ML00_9RHOB|nr:hypothetical protein SAMN05216227_105710 [Pseudorhodobacter antarcticus]
MNSLSLKQPIKWLYDTQMTVMYLRTSNED